MTPAQPIDVLLVEDDAGDEMITQEAFQQNKIANKLHVARDGEKAWTFSTAAASTTTPRELTSSCSESPPQDARFLGPASN